jgi:hypothetical protein
MSRRHALIVVLFAATACVAADPKETVPGPESDKLRPLTSGCILIDRASREITAIELPGLQETIIRPTRPKGQDDDPTIHALSGPDEQGRIAYIEDHFFVRNENNRRHLLKTIRLDSTQDIELFTRPGDAMWARKGEIGKQIALSPIGGRVAFLSGLSKTQMPGALLEEGPIEIWDIEKKTGSRIDIKAIDDELSWFPDGKRLVYVKLVEVNSDRKEQEADFFGTMYRDWNQVPAVFLRDVISGEASFVGIGWRPRVSIDGRRIMFTSASGEIVKAFDVAGRTTSKVKWAHGCHSPIAILPGDIGVCWSLPTEGLRVKQTQNNSPLVGPKQMLSLKLAKLNSEEFETVVPYVDPRDRISFGVVKRE